MSDAKTKTERRTARPPSKQNRVVLTIPPHIRLFMDPGSLEYYDQTWLSVILAGIKATMDYSEEEMMTIWRGHCQKSMDEGVETPYCWRGMRMDW